MLQKQLGNESQSVMGKPEVKSSKNKHFQKKPFKLTNSGSSVGGQGFAQSRKRKCMKKYGKFLKKGLKDVQNNQNSKKESAITEGKTSKIKSNEFITARQNFKEEEKARLQRKREIEESKRIHQQSVEKNIQKRKRLSKELSKKTKKGQPFMKNQIEHMLDKIKSRS